MPKARTLEKTSQHRLTRKINKSSAKMSKSLMLIEINTNSIKCVVWFKCSVHCSSICLCVPVRATLSSRIYLFLRNCFTVSYPCWQPQNMSKYSLPLNRPTLFSTHTAHEVILNCLLMQKLPRKNIGCSFEFLTHSYSYPSLLL